MGMIYCDGNNSLRRAECIATGIIACDGNDSATGMMNGNDGTQEKNFECSECGKGRSGGTDYVGDIRGTDYLRDSDIATGEAAGSGNGVEAVAQGVGSGVPAGTGIGGEEVPVAITGYFERLVILLRNHPTVLPQLKEQEMPPAQPQKEQETGVPRPAQASLFLPRHSQGIIRCDGNDTYTEIVSAPDVPYIKKTAKPKHADDGIGRTGTFCAAYSMMDRVKVEQVVDAFQTIKSMRIQRAGLLDSLAQYIFLHSALLEFLSTFDAYQNFK
eukprot:Em0922g2a